MLRKLLGIVAALVLPSLLAGQAPGNPSPVTAQSTLALARGVATQVQGEVVRVEQLDGPNRQQVVDPEDPDGPNDQEDMDEGGDEPDDLNDDADMDDVDVDEEVDQADDDEDDAAASAPQSGKALSRIGRHKP